MENFLNKKFKMLPQIKTPTRTPNAIGNRNLKFCLMSLKKLVIEFMIFSYKPKTTHKTPLLIPGKIAPIPIVMPTKKFFKKITYLIYIKRIK